MNNVEEICRWTDRSIKQNKYFENDVTMDKYHSLKKKKLFKNYFKTFTKYVGKVSFNP